MVKHSSNYNNKYIRKLIVDNNSELTNLEQIIQEEKRFYQKLYTSQSKQNIHDEETSFLKNNSIPKLSKNDQQLCEMDLTMDECTKALKLLSNDKSPGPDGFTTNFFKFFWIDIKEILFSSFQYSLKNKTLSNDQRRGILHLIPKSQKDLRYLSNWRPVSLLQTCYKILTKALAIRLQKILPKIVSSDQVGYISGRYIGENIRTIADLMTCSAKLKIPGYIVLIDFEKAFDSVEWEFLFKTLESFNFGPQFINWIKLLYTNISSCVGNNGYYSNYFQLKRGIRQGCPISALLFILVAEVIAICLRQNKCIKGL